MTNSTGLEDVHEVTCNQAAAAPRRFHSSEPSLGHNDKRHKVNEVGFEALAGYSAPLAAPQGGPRIRPISELTFGPPLPGPESVAAPAGAPLKRAAVTDTKIYPWRANCALVITVPGYSDRFLATGWFIGPYAVMTAAHAVFPREKNGHFGWVTKIEVLPGLNGFGVPPVEPFGRFVSDTFFCPTSWQDKNKEQTAVDHLDYGVLLLKEAVGLTVGTYGFATYATNDLLSAGANLSGYPITSPDQTDPQGRQWYGASNVIKVDDLFVCYDLGTRAGDSGGCVYRIIGNQSYAMAIHTGSNGNLDRGVRIIDPVYANLKTWSAMQG